MEKQILKYIYEEDYEFVIQSFDGRSFNDCLNDMLIHLGDDIKFIDNKFTGDFGLKYKYSNKRKVALKPGVYNTLFEFDVFKKNGSFNKNFNKLVTFCKVYNGDIDGNDLDEHIKNKKFKAPTQKFKKHLEFNLEEHNKILVIDMEYFIK